jgi:hypothetical protein
MPVILADDWRMCKKQQMGWSRAGAQYLLHVKTAIINRQLDRYTGIIQYSRTSPPDPQVFAGLDLSTVRQRFLISICSHLALDSRMTTRRAGPVVRAPCDTAAISTTVAIVSSTATTAMGTTKRSLSQRFMSRLLN